MSIANGNTVDLGSYLDNTDAQTLNLSANILSISSGNSVNLASYLDNTDNQSLTYSNDTLYIQNGNNVYLGGTNQSLSLSGNNLSISGGNTVTLNNVTFTGQTKLDGTFTYKIKNVDGNDDPYTAGDETLILADGSLGAMQVRLPAAASVPGRVYIIKKIDNSANAITINPNSVETIDGVLTPTLSTQFAFLKVISTGSSWYIIGN